MFVEHVDPQETEHERGFGREIGDEDPSRYSWFFGEKETTGGTGRGYKDPGWIPWVQDEEVAQTKWTVTRALALVLGLILHGGLLSARREDCTLVRSFVLIFLRLSSGHVVLFPPRHRMPGVSLHRRPFVAVRSRDSKGVIAEAPVPSKSDPFDTDVAVSSRWRSASPSGHPRARGNST